MNDDLQFKNRRGVLKVVGVLLILTGFGSLLMIPFLLLGLAVGSISGQESNISSAIPSLFLFVGLGIIFIILGFGSYKIKRWARTLILIFHWLWLVSGVFSLVFFILLFPQMIAQMNSELQDPAIIHLIYIMILLLSALVFIIHPIVIILLYQNRDTRATVEHYDPDQYWTDRCPGPVLVLCFMQFYLGLSMLSAGLAQWIVPFFGLILSGFSGAALVIALMVLYIYLAFETYLLKIRAWWISLGLILMSSVSFFITLAQHDYLAIVTRCNLSSEQRLLLVGMKDFWNRDFPALVLIMAMAYIVYLLFIKKYFLLRKSS